MNSSWLEKWQVRQNVSLAHLTTWHVGGPAKYFYELQDIDNLQAFLRDVPDHLDIFWLGLGSNVLIRDHGFPGLVISTRKGLQAIEALSETEISAQSGVACAKFARVVARGGLLGGEFFAGIPGTIGGALAMNAGCWGSETWEFVSRVQMINRQGQLTWRTPKEFELAYRHVGQPHSEWFISAHFQFAPGDSETGLKKIRELLDKRAASQPTGEHTCGSVFRNPPNHYAAKLIEACGLKGYQIGGAHVSPKHANFIVNDGTASASDIEKLINHISITVETQYNIRLIKEVKILGDV